MRRGFFLLALLALLIGQAPLASAETIHLWHSYRGDERAAIDKLVSTWNAAHPELQVEPLALPYDAFSNKLTNAIPHGHGPDLFIAAHERIGDWAESGLIAHLGEDELGMRANYGPATLDALTYNKNIYGWPLAFKSTALYVNTKALGNRIPPTNTSDLLAFCATFKAAHPTDFCLAYEAGSIYHHAAWLHGFGGGVFDSAGKLDIASSANIRSFAFSKRLMDLGYVPQEPNAALVSQLFNEGRAVFAINGPWMMGEISPDVAYSVMPIPTVSDTNLPSRPYLTVEGVLLSTQTQHRDAAIKFARFLAEKDGAIVRAATGHQAVAFQLSADDAAKSFSPPLYAFSRMQTVAVPMPNVPVMRTVWEPLAQALRKVQRGDYTPEEALKNAQAQISIYTRPAPPPTDPLPYLLALVVLAMAGGVWLWRRSRHTDLFKQLWSGRTAYAYIAPAALGIIILVFIPFVVGTLVSFYSHKSGNYTFVGMSNYVSILSGGDYGFFQPMSFYFTLAVTVLWTSLNVALHVTIGLSLALLLREPWLKLRGIYRVILIVPWAVPNYITALIWKGMFHKQFGAINGILGLFGVEPVSWFSHFWTAFAANVATNTWLGFPFMMVVMLGALQAIPRDLEEAAEVDGANAFQRFFSVTLPLLKPALLPAVILGSVWTFNGFNIIYLVSGGEPDSATEILISEAYRWAFTRQEQYGYAAAYATLIFLVLLAYSRGTRKLLKES